MAVYTEVKTSIKNEIKIEVHIIPTNLNINNLEETINFLLNNLGITHIKLLRLIFHGRAGENSDMLVFDNKVLYNTIFRLKYKYNNSKVEIGTAFSFLSNSCTECQAGYNKYMITADLKLFPCTAFKNQDTCFIQLSNRKILKSAILNNHLKIQLDKYTSNLKCAFCLQQCKA